MAKSLGSLTLDLIAKVGSFTGPMDKASKQTKKFADDAGKYGKFAGAAIGAGAIAAVAGIGLLVSKQRELIDTQAKSAQQLDTTYGSLTVLARAAELGGIGMEKVEAASRQLNISLGKAIQGSATQAAAFDRLRLSAQEIYDLPLDERISTINAALRDNVKASERAAVGADIFGAEAAKAIQQLDPATIAEANRQAIIFGTKLSDIDAAKVEMANDAMSTFALLGDGIAKQLTVELSPALKALGDQFLQTAEDANGMGNIVQVVVVGDVVEAVAFVASAVDSVGRAFSIATDIAITEFSVIKAYATRTAAEILNVLDVIPGIDLSLNVEALRQSSSEAADIAKLAGEAISDALNRPLAGEALKKFYKDAQDGAEAAAKATVQGRKDVTESGKSFVETETKKLAATKKTTDSINSQIASLQFQADTVGMASDAVTLYKLSLEGATAGQLQLAEAALNTVSAYEAQAKAIEEAQKAQENTNTEAKSIAESLQSEEESLLSSYERRRKIVLENTAITGDAQAKLLRDLEEKKNEDLISINGSYWEQYLAAAEDALTSFDELASSTVENFSSQFGDAFESMVFDAESLDDAVTGMAENMARSVVNALGQMAAQWLAYQVVQLLVGKTTQASAAATMTANAAATSAQAGLAAFASTAAIPIVGPFAAPAAAALALATTAPMVAAVSASALAGMAHDGIMSVPSSGTWNLEKGERVLTAQTSATMDKTFEQILANKGAGSSHVNNINIDMSGITNKRDARESGAAVARQVARVVQSSGRYR